MPELSTLLQQIDEKLAEFNALRPLQPIDNPAEFEKATQIIVALIDANLITDPEDRQQALAILEAISILATEYEKKHFSIPQSAPLP